MDDGRRRVRCGGGRVDDDAVTAPPTDETATRETETARAVHRGDYDGRTPLHLAAAEGHREMVRFMLALGVERAPKDRWGNTPYHEAHKAVRRTADDATAAETLDGGVETEHGAATTVSERYRQDLRGAPRTGPRALGATTLAIVAT